MTIFVKPDTLLEPDCYIDGHLGQYTGPALVELADELLGTSFADDWPKDEDGLLGLYGLLGTPYADILGDTSVEIMMSLMDEIEAALNDATEGGSWSWEDGEFFLSEDSEDDDG